MLLLMMVDLVLHFLLLFPGNVVLETLEILTQILFEVQHRRVSVFEPTLLLSLVLVCIEQLCLLLLYESEVPEQIQLIRIRNRQFGIFLMILHDTWESILHCHVFLHRRREHFVVLLQFLIVSTLAIVDIVHYHTVPDQLLVCFVVHQLLVSRRMHPLEHIVDNRVIRDTRDPFVVAAC